MDFSPCRVAKMKLHSRIETYLKLPQSEALAKLNFEALSPISTRNIKVKPDKKGRIVESYKPSSCVYKKLNAKIHLNKIEFFRTLTGSPESKSKLQRKNFKRIIRQHAVNPAHLQTHGRSVNEVFRKSPEPIKICEVKYSN